MESSSGAVIARLGVLRAGRGRAAMGVASVLVALALAGGSAWVASADGPGSLQVTVLPAKSAPDGAPIVVRVANVGGGVVSAVRVTVGGPTGVTADQRDLGDLAAGSAQLVEFTLRGAPASRPATLVVRASGTSQAGPTADLASVDLVAAEPAVTLAVNGNKRLTNDSPADLVAVLTNAADSPATVSVRASAGPHTVRLATTGTDVSAAAPNEAVRDVTVSARGTLVVDIEVNAQRPLRRGSAGVVVTATVAAAGGATSEVTAATDLDVALSADVLPGLLGVGSVLVIPGLVAVWAFLAVWLRDRRRIGLVVASAGSQIWDNKLWLLLAGAVSLAAALVYAWLGFADLLDTYTLGDVAQVALIAGVLGAAAAAVVVWWHRRTVAAVTPASTPLAVLRAACAADAGLTRVVYRTPDGKRGLRVHADRSAVVLTPQITFAELAISPQVQEGKLGEAIQEIEATHDGEAQLGFDTAGGGLDGPRAVPDAVATSERLPILKPAPE